jgi:hypothetical protein
MKKQKKPRPSPSFFSMPRRPRSRFGAELDKILAHFFNDTGYKHPFFENCIEHYRDTYLRSYNVSGDGHCLFYAVIRCIVSAYDRLSAATKRKANLHIGDTAIQKFRNGAYLGEPQDVTKLRGEVYLSMDEVGDSSECIGAALSALEHSREGRGLDSGSFADLACRYLSAIAKTLDICIALEYPFTSGRITTRKWALFQPDRNPFGNPERSMDQIREAGMLDEYNRKLQSGTQTPEPEVKCKQVIYLRFDMGHYTSYLYKGEFEPGKDTEARRLRLEADQKLAQQIRRQEEEEEAQRESERRDRAVVSGLGLSDEEIAEHLAAHAAIEAKRQRFGTPSLRRNTAFVSHVLRAARSSRLGY